MPMRTILLFVILELPLSILPTVVALLGTNLTTTFSALLWMWHT